MAVATTLYANLVLVPTIPICPSMSNNGPFVPTYFEGRGQTSNDSLYKVIKKATSVHLSFVINKKEGESLFFKLKGSNTIIEAICTVDKKRSQEQFEVALKKMIERDINKPEKLSSDAEKANDFFHTFNIQLTPESVQEAKNKAPQPSQIVETDAIKGTLFMHFLKFAS